MDSVKAMIVWTPNSELYEEYPSKGKISVTTIPESAELKDYPMSVGACDHDWQGTDSQGRKKLMQRYFTQMIHRDGLDEGHVLAAISVIDDFRGYSFSNKAPAEDDNTWY